MVQVTDASPRWRLTVDELAALDVDVPDDIVPETSRAAGLRSLIARRLVRGDGEGLVIDRELDEVRRRVREADRVVLLTAVETSKAPMIARVFEQGGDVVIVDSTDIVGVYELTPIAGLLPEVILNARAFSGEPTAAAERSTCSYELLRTREDIVGSCTLQVIDAATDGEIPAMRVLAWVVGGDGPYLLSAPDTGEPSTVTAEPVGWPSLRDSVRGAISGTDW